ncbi:hypothetical protein [[Limnothrix rosea] IAM M-220]|uniref:hypothetical protein n=1 Tax=[Limnothrix rosea] IAM M-220 TaxID=454133 RepID=UPI00095A1252|nr:hypothetical protein [[Limnothrix rosea] IAM M-220]OKH11885.1 hypothetical protein NIES208_16800 [[Limnothrix rosea] IAM M-220]
MEFIRNFQATARLLFRGVIAFVMFLGLSSCGDRQTLSTAPQFNNPSEPVVTEQLTEVATPSLITQLREELTQYQPQVKIISPQPNELLTSSNVSVKLEVNDLPLFKDPDLGMGPHLHLFIDDQPYRAVYDVSEPIILEDLTPGSHLLRVFASRPWHESFKNEGAYAETMFSIFTENNSRLPDFSQPLLTYSRPQGTYGAEPIMLDFYLTNAPLHFVANETQEDNVADWRIRVTVNGETFILDNWQPIYLKGFKKGENWLKLEFINDQGELVENVFNNPVRVIDYDPKLNDTLAKLVQNKLSLRTAKKLVSTKELPPEVEVEILKPETALPELINEPTPEIIEFKEPNSETEILQDQVEVESEAKDDTEVNPAIAPTESLEGDGKINELKDETIEAEIEEILDDIQVEIEETIDPNIDSFEAPEELTEKDESEVELDAAEAEPTVAETSDQAADNEMIELPDSLDSSDFSRTTDIYTDDIKLEP